MDPTLQAAVEAHLGEAAEHAMTFSPGGRWAQPTGWSRIWRRLRGTTRLDDRLSMFHPTVLAVTPTRVAVIEGSTMSGAFELTGTFAIWDRSQVTASAQRVEMSDTRDDAWSVSGYSVDTLKVIRLRLITPDGELWADLPTGSREPSQLANALGAKVAPAKV